ncbi:hypothetical protein CGLO_10499 [Colletotrichum gloeosporioides Cg-14]|uniref:Uncharacterized protein n=1 Tax=Colletotrichum gloeosporioides (strain Cg-14) TaxID=1237896 RepID=T0KDD0_COLGC|nr:hypothetical protein CGLO_10499 [Colletotrichum gloeosporioides Cg-14]
MDLVQKTYDNKATLYDGQTKESDEINKEKSLIGN